MNQRPRFDVEPDWQAYDQPLEGDPNDAWDTASGSSDGSNPSSFGSSRSPSPAPSSIPGSYVPPHRRRFEHGILANDDGALGVVSRRGNLKKLAAPWDKPGAYRKIHLVKYALSTSQLGYMTKNFPNTFFSVVKDHNHDHPIAHLETEIASRHCFDTIPDGSRILDLFGNPRARDTFMNRRDLRGRTMETVVSLMTEKDYLRKNTKWGPQYDVNGQIRYHMMGMDDLVDDANAAWVSQFDTFLLIHTGYYVKMDQLAKLLSRNEGSVAKLVVHRHDRDQAKMFDGECEYVNRNNMVVQRNVATGERYIHPSLEWMFQSCSKVWRCANGAITWTFKKVTKDTWIIDVVACPNDLDERFGAYVHYYEGDRAQAAHRMNEEAMLDVAMTYKQPVLPGCDVVSQGGVLTVTASAVGVKFRLTNMPYYEYLCSTIIGKPRNDANLAELYAVARRENALTSTFPGSKRFEVPPDEVADHVVLAWMSGLQRETELLGVIRAAGDQVARLHRLATGDHVDLTTDRGKVKTLIKGAKAFNDIRRAKDTFSAILDTAEKVT